MDVMTRRLRVRGFSDESLIEGGEPAQQRARDEYRHERRLRVAMNSEWPQLAGEDLQPAHAGLLEHRSSGDYYIVSRGEHDDPQFSTAVAYYFDVAGHVVFLERPASGPARRAELAEQQAEQEQRRNAPRPRPAWMQR